MKLHFNDYTPGDNTTGITESWAGGSASNSQVNVATAATLQQALNIAASQASVIDQQFNGATNTTVLNQNTPTASLQENAHTGLLDWFQFGGNTYLVEAVNSGAANATHTALGTNDIVVELTGLVDANHVNFAHIPTV